MKSFATVEREIASHGAGSSVCRGPVLSKADLVPPETGRCGIWGLRPRAAVGRRVRDVVVPSLHRRRHRRRPARRTVVRHRTAEAAAAALGAPAGRWRITASTARRRDGYRVERTGERAFRVSGHRVERSARASTTVDNDEAMTYVEDRPASLWVIRALDAEASSPATSGEDLRPVFELDPGTPFRP